MSDAIRCEQLSKHYGEVTAVNQLDLTIPSGTIFGFLGRNGAGKTTTIRMLTGLIQATSGKAWINNIPADHPDSRHHFGYLPQDPAFYNWMTPTQYLNYVGDLFQLEAKIKKNRISELLERVGLENAGKRKIGGFSGGMIQRLGIAQALLHEPSILFLDEPTSALDPSGRYDLLTLIEALSGEVTIFLSSHILADIERVCSMIGIIHQGNLIRVEDRDSLLNAFSNNHIFLELHQESMPQVDSLIHKLQQQSWLNDVNQENAQLDLLVKDKESAQSEILPLLVSHNVQINKLEWKRPSLEDIFLSLSQS